VNITDARLFVRDYARNAGDSSVYSAATIDRAIQAAADNFIQSTKLTKQTSGLSLTADLSNFSLSLSDFRPERALGCWIAGVTVLAIVDHQAIVQEQINFPTTGIPLQIGFDSWVSGDVYPTPSTSCTVNLQWAPPFTSWTPGGDDPGTVNIPDDFMRTLLRTKVVANLQKYEPEHAKAVAEAEAEYKDFLARVRGTAGSLGEKAAMRFLED
jgi:hypothetical protein